MGDIVTVHDDNHPRGLWKLGRVRELIPGADGNIRGAVIRVQSGGGHSTIKRPIQRLYPLEVREEVGGQETVPFDDVMINQPCVDTAMSKEGIESRARPRRRAAIDAQESVKAWMKT